MEGIVRVEVHPTESLEKVVNAVQAVMGEIELHESDQGPITILEGRFEKMDNLLPLRDL